MRFFLTAILFVFLSITNACLASASVSLPDEALDAAPIAEQAPTRYLFATQTRDTCLYSAVINWLILQHYKEGRQPVALTKRQWFGVVYSAMRAIQCVEEEMRELSGYRAFLESGLREKDVYVGDGGKLVHLSEYEGKGDESSDLMTRLSIVNYALYVSKDYADPINTPVMPVLPIRFDRPKAFFIDGKGDEVELKASESRVGDIGTFSLTPSQRVVLGLKDGERICYSGSITLLGAEFSSAYKFTTKAEDIVTPYEVTTSYTYGSYLMMLWTVGLNAQGHEMEEKGTAETEFKMAGALRASIKNHLYHPWAYLTQENFFEAQLIKVLHQNADLKKRMQGAIDIEGSLSPWAASCASMDYYTGEGQSRRAYFQELFGHKDVENNVPFLAYTFSRQLNALWAAAISQKAWASVLELDEVIDDKSPLASVFPTLHGNMIKNSERFVALFKEVRKSLEESDYVSFFGHGNVMTFDPGFVGHQKRTHEDPEVLTQMRAVAHALGFSKIESTYHEGIDPIYQVRAVPVRVPSMSQTFQVMKEEIMRRHLQDSGLC